MEPGDVDIVFADLESSFEDLQKAQSAPRAVRRAFSRFVTLTQQLTETMRREFSATKGTSWAACQFPGWTPVTKLFKQLRRSDQHGTGIQVLVHESATARSDLGALVTLSGTWELHDQLAQAPPDGLVAVRADPVTGEPADDPLPIVDRSFRFLLRPRDAKTRRMLEEAGSEDMHVLASACLQTLREYHLYYRKKLV